MDRPGEPLAPLQPALSILLRDVPLFRSLPQESERCYQLLNLGRVENFPPGSALADPGAPADFMVVLSGEVFAGPVRYGRGAVIGDAAFVLGQPLKFRSLAATTVVIYRLPAALSQDILEECHFLRRRLLHAFALRIYGAEPAT